MPPTECRISAAPCLRSLLALRTPERASLPNDFTDDGATAAPAPLPFPSVGPQSGNVVAGTSVREQVRQIIQRGAPIAKRVIKSFLDRLAQCRCLGEIDRSPGPVRCDLRPMQGFVRIDVAETGQDALVEEQRFDRSGPSGEQPVQLPTAWEICQSISTKLGDRRFFELDGGVRRHKPESSWINEPKIDAAIQGDDNVGMSDERSVARDEADASRHAEMCHPRNVGVEVCQEELAVATHPNDLLAAQTPHKIGRIGLPPQHPVPCHLYLGDPRSLQRRGHAAAGCFDFWEFGQRRPLLITLGCIRSGRLFGALFRTAATSTDDRALDPELGLEQLGMVRT